MRVLDSIAAILKKEGVDFLSCYPTTHLIESVATVGIRPLICRQERVGVGIADGFSRVNGGERVGVFAMQYGPGAENAFSGVATAHADSVPMLLLPLANARAQAQVFPLFDSARAYAAVTKSLETLILPSQTAEVMRRAFAALRAGRPGPVMVEIPADVATEEAGEVAASYRPPKGAKAAADPRDVEAAARALLEAEHPVIYAGQGVLYAGAMAELLELAELLQLPVLTSLEGKSAFPEDHPLSLGTASALITGHGLHFMRGADLVFAVGASLTRHGMATNIPAGKAIIHATNDPRDLDKNYPADYPVLGDAKLVLRQFIEAAKDLAGGRKRGEDGAVAAEIERVRERWLAEWLPKLTSDEVPITPYRVIWEFMRAVNPAEAIVTHDSGSPRDQLTPFYRATTPHGYVGWGKSHGLGTGLGLIMGAKLAAPEKFCVNFMGDAAFGMVGLDLETAVRNRIPTLTVVLNNSTMAIETGHLVASHELYRTRDLGGDYATIARGLGAWAERVERPEEIGPAIQRARRVTEDGRTALLEIITGAETAFSFRRAL